MVDGNTHKTELLGYFQLANGVHTVLIRCCGGWLHQHTMNPEVLNDEEKLKSSLEWAHVEAAKNHKAATESESKLKSMVGATVDHP